MMEKLLVGKLDKKNIRRIEEYEQYQKKIIKRIEKHEQYLVENNILAGVSNFRSEVESFYGFFTYDNALPPFDTKIGIMKKSKLKDWSAKNKGIYPRDLVEILSNFSKKSFDASKLQCDSVREDYQIWNSFSRKAIRILLSIVAFVGLIGGLVISLGVINESYPVITIKLIAGVSMIISVIIFFWLNSSSYPRPSKTNGGLAEYKRLYESAGRADWFMDHTYREHYVKKCHHEN